MKIIGKKLEGLPHYRRREVHREILESHEMQDILSELARKKNQTVDHFREKSRRILRELTSNYRPTFLHWSYHLVHRLQKMLFDDVVVKPDELARIHDLIRDKKIMIFLPNHKSHLDYILISYILYKHHIAPPHIAAGVNLSFWPMGTLFRITGAYFIRRKISGNFLYTKILENYFGWMLRLGISQEFYMEGGRSRDGKLREVQSGLFTMLSEQIVEKKIQSQTYVVPIAVTYDAVPDMSGLLPELKGQKKRKETVFALLRAGSVFFRKHGRVQIRFLPPISFSELLPDHPAKKDFHAGAVRIFNDIQIHKPISSTSILASAILLFQKKLTQKELDSAIQSVFEICKSIPMSMNSFSEVTGSHAIEHGLKWGWLEEKDGGYRIVSKKRMEMNYYKNELMPFLIPAILLNLREALEVAEVKWVQWYFEQEYRYLPTSLQTNHWNPELNKVLIGTAWPGFELLSWIARQNLSVEKIPETEELRRYSENMKENHFPFREVRTIDAIRRGHHYVARFLADETLKGRQPEKTIEKIRDLTKKSLFPESVSVESNT